MKRQLRKYVKARSYPNQTVLPQIFIIAQYVWIGHSIFQIVRNILLCVKCNSSFLFQV